jgi:hypothetical protein
MADYEPYFIGDMTTGKFISKEPWLAPADGWPVLVNARLDKGILSKRAGYASFISSGFNGLAITGMGMVRSLGYNEVIVCNTKRAFHLHYNQVLTDLCGGDVFTGSSTDYFWFQAYNGNLYFCNGIDPIYKHTPNYTQPYTVSAMNTGDVTIQTCKMLFQYKNRLLIVSPKINNIWYPDRMYYTDVLLDNVGATNFVVMQGNETPISGGYVADVPVIFTREGSIYHLAYTFNTDAPFTWDKKSGDWPCVARMGCASFRDNISAIGKNRLFLYDRYQSRNYDLAVRGILSDMDSQKVINSYAHTLKDRESMMAVYTASGSSAHNRILEYNIEEYSFSQHLITCNCILSVDGPWLAYGSSYAYPVSSANERTMTIAGTANGLIYQLNTGATDLGANITGMDIRSAQFNPYQKEGLKAKLGWVKFFVNISSGLAIDVALHKNYSDTPYKTYRLDGTDSQQWLTCYADGEVSDWHQIRLSNYTYDDITGGTIDIHGLLLGFKKAGRMGSQIQYEAEEVGAPT